MKSAVIESWNLRQQYPHIYYSSSYEPFLPFFYWYTKYLPSKLANGTCNPAGNTIWGNTNYFQGMQISQHYFFGYLDWSQLISQKKILSEILFVISQKDYITLTDLSKNQSQPFSLNIIWQIGQKYTEQENIYLVSLDGQN